MTATPPPDARPATARPAPPGPSDSPVADVSDLRVTFTSRRRTVEAVRGVSFTVGRGQCVAIVGESGSGKSVTARALVGLAGPGAEVTAAGLRIAATDARALTERRWRALRGRHVGFVLQDALGSLDPLRRVGDEVAEPLRAHGLVPRAERPARVRQLLAAAGVPQPGLRARQYAHQLSGGLRQRSLIASALAGEPSLLIADEPTTALDVSVQARILRLLAEFKRAGTGLLLISHDLAVVAQIADYLYVMHEGGFVEEGVPAAVLAAPRHPYTRRLLAAVPVAHAKGTRLSAPPPDPTRPPSDRDEVPRIAGQTSPGAGQLDSDASQAVPGSPESAPGAGRTPPGGRKPDTPRGGTDVVRTAPDEPQVGSVSAESAPDATGTPSGPGQVPPWVAATPSGRPESPAGREEVPSGTARVLGRGARWTAGGPEAPSERLTSGASGTVLEAVGVGKSFGGPGRERLLAVDGVSLAVRAGRTLGVVGESGSGKSTLARMLAGLSRPDHGHVAFRGAPLAGPRPQIQVVHQDPFSSFDPRYTVRQILEEPLRAARRGRTERTERTAELLGQVGLSPGHLALRPRELSGGQRQRVAIARALAADPAVLVCDEPVSALDVSIQAQILDLFADLQAATGLAYVFVSHDLGVIYHVADEVMVMRGGRSVETGPAERVFTGPRHEYTRSLLAAVPTLDGLAVRRHPAESGTPGTATVATPGKARTAEPAPTATATAATATGGTPDSTPDPALTPTAPDTAAPAGPRAAAPAPTATATAATATGGTPDSTPDPALTADAPDTAAPAGPRAAAPDDAAAPTRPTRTGEPR